MIPCLLAALIFAGSVGTPREQPQHEAIGTALVGGRANYADPSHGRDYLAMRLPRGTKVTICGVECVDMTVNDYGPAESTHDIADIALVRFAKVCGWSIEKARRMGECDVEVEILSMSLPETSTED